METYTETETEGYGSRIKTSLANVGIGVLLVFLSIGALVWNESNLVKTRKALDEGEAAVVELPSIDKIDSKYEGKLVHFSGTVKAGSDVTDKTFGVSVPDALKLQRSVEMYQWEQTKKTTTKKNIGGSKTKTTEYSYRKQWVPYHVDSSHFARPTGHENPSALLFEWETFTANPITIGSYTLDDVVLEEIQGFEPIDQTFHVSKIPQATKDNVNGRYEDDDDADDEKEEDVVVVEEDPVTAEEGGSRRLASGSGSGSGSADTAESGSADSAESGSADSAESGSADTDGSEDTTTTTTTTTKVEDDKSTENAIKFRRFQHKGFYVGKGTNSNPVLGDARVTFTAIPAKTISVVAKLEGSSFGEYTTSNDHDIVIVADGVVSAEKMFDEENSDLTKMTWIIRGLTFVAMWIALLLVVEPLSVFADVLPILGNLVDCMAYIVTGLLALCLSLITIALSWLFFRPLFSLCIFGGIAAIFVGLRFLKGNKKGYEEVGLQDPDVPVKASYTDAVPA